MFLAAKFMSLVAAGYAVLQTHPSVCFVYRVIITGTLRSVLFQNVNGLGAVIPDMHKDVHALGSLPCSLIPLYCSDAIC